MKKKLRVIFIPDKLQYKANKMNGTRLFYYFDKISKNNPLLYALFNATFKVINKIDYEIIGNGNIKEVVFQDEISFSYDGKVYVSMFELIKRLNEEIFEIRLDNRFMKTEGEVSNVHIRFFFFCEDGAKWGHKEVVFCCIYDYQEKLRKNMNSMYINIKNSANVITNSKFNDGKFLKQYFTGKPEHFKLYLE